MEHLEAALQRMRDGEQPGCAVLISNVSSWLTIRWATTPAMSSRYS